MIENILFDLDGTLTDPGVGITKSVRYAFESLGLTSPPLAELTRFVGPPLDEAFGGFYGFSEEMIARAVASFREYFAEQGILENTLYPGMPQLLQALHKGGKRLYVATSKPTVFAHAVLKNFGLADYFLDVEGSPLAHHGLPKAQVVQEVLRRNAIAPASAAMVGDRRHDIVGGRENGLVTVGVLYGYGDREEHETAGADYIAEDLPALQTLLLSL